MRRFSLFAVTVLLAASCGGSSSGGPSGSGGASSSSGGATGSGGSASGTGGASSSSGGAASSGGKTGSGGMSSSSGGSTGSGGVVGTGGASSSGGAVGTGGSAPGSGGAQAGSGGATASGGTTGSGGMKAAGGATGSGGAATGGAGGTSTGGGGAGVPPASSFSCNTVLGIDSTNEWFSGGFENEVPNAKWQIIYFHPGYVSDWANYPSDAVWSQAPTSACSMNSTNPERVVYNAFADPSDSSYQAAAGWVSGMTKVVEALKKKYSNLKRVDLLTVTRGPNNMVCSGDSQMFSMIPSYVDDAIATVAAMYPGFVTAAPKFYAPSCDDFDSSMKPPHLSTTGKPIIAKLYGDYYSMEP